MRAHILVIALLVSLTSACVSYKSDRRHVEGQITDPDRLANIQIGATHSDWLVERFGEPDSIDRIADDEAVWRYSSTTRKARKFHALLLLSYETRQEQRTLYNFAIVDDRIERYWTETAK